MSKLLRFGVAGEPLVRRMHVINVGELYLTVTTLMRSQRIDGDGADAFDLGVKIWFDDAPSSSGEITLSKATNGLYSSSWAHEVSEWCSVEIRNAIERALLAIPTRSGRDGRTKAILQWVASHAAEMIAATAKDLGDE